MRPCHEIDLDKFVELRFGVVHMRTSLQDAQARRPRLERELTEAVGEDWTNIDLPFDVWSFVACAPTKYSTETDGDA